MKQALAGSHLCESMLTNTTASITLVRYPERVFLEVNQATLDLMGCASRDEIVGKPTGFLYFDTIEQQRMLDTALQILDKGQGGLRDLHVLRKNGQELYLDVSGQRIDREDPDHPVIVWTSVDVTERYRLTEELARQALFDKLTNLPNRHFLETQIERDMARAKRHEQILAICMLDLDGFKPVNDAHGHGAGDEVLVALGKRLPEALRKSDFVARWGGDEFVLVVEALSTLDGLANILQKVEKAVSAPIHLENGETVQIGVSMGVAIYHFDEKEAPNHFLRMADQALYESKAHKEDRERSWVFFGEKV